MHPVVVGPAVKGWCPGARRPMECGDGLLVRVRPHGPILSGDACSALADLSARIGNGTIELTGRANLQLRGLKADALPEVHAVLARHNILDSDAELEAVRNVVVSPLAGCDETASLDGLSMLQELEAGLATDTRLRGLPAKFSFLVDEGGRLPLDDIHADIRIKAAGNEAEISIGGDGSSAITIARVVSAGAARLALDVAAAFAANGGRRRIHGNEDAEALRQAAGRHAVPSHSLRQSRTTGLPQLVGPQQGYFGVAAPSGCFRAAQIEGLAALGVSEIRLTPWRALLLPGFGLEATPALAALGLIVDPFDPRLRVVACSGAPACSSGEVETREIAEALAPSLVDFPGHGPVLHVSGCVKGCARSVATPLTLVGRDARYDLVLDGRADGAPSLRGLSASQLAAAILAAAPARRIAS